MMFAELHGLKVIKLNNQFIKYALRTEKLSQPSQPSPPNPAADDPVHGEGGVGATLALLTRPPGKYIQPLRLLGVGMAPALP